MSGVSGPTAGVSGQGVTAGADLLREKNIIDWLVAGG